MSARIWFTAENCTMGPPLSAVDLAVMNRATRHLVDDHLFKPSQAELEIIRSAYRSGMSANDLVDDITDRLWTW